MTYPRALQYGIGGVLDDFAGVSEESKGRRKKWIDVTREYLMPISRISAEPAIKFSELKEEWETNTAHLSSITEIAMYPAYQQVIGMGKAAIPLILAELKKKPGHWFWALKAITGEEPVLPEQRGRMKQMAEARLRWGKEHGYSV